MDFIRIVVRSIPLGQGESKTFYQRLLVRRGKDWECAGIFQLLQPEWLALAAHCQANGVEITHEVPVDEPAPAAP